MTAWSRLSPTKTPKWRRRPPAGSRISVPRPCLRCCGQLVPRRPLTAAASSCRPRIARCWDRIVAFGPDAVPDLLAVLETTDPSEERARIGATIALGELGEQAEGAARPLGVFLNRTGEPAVRVLAAGAIASVGSSHEEHVRAFAELQRSLTACAMRTGAGSVEVRLALLTAMSRVARRGGDRLDVPVAAVQLVAGSAGAGSGPARAHGGTDDARRPSSAAIHRAAHGGPRRSLVRPPARRSEIAGEAWRAIRRRTRSGRSQAAALGSRDAAPGRPGAGGHGRRRRRIGGSRARAGTGRRVGRGAACRGRRLRDARNPGRRATARGSRHTGPPRRALASPRWQHYRPSVPMPPTRSGR